MKISIVTISYNQQAYLKQCIDSVLSQDVDLEYIIVDPGSTDGSRDLIESYGDKLHKVVFEPDDGPADGLNKGFQYATGDIFGFINADDFLLPNALKTVSTVLKNDNAKIMSGSGIRLIDGREKLVRPTIMTFQQLLYRSTRIFQQSTFFNRDLYISVGGFNKYNRTCWDYELFVDMLAKGAIHKTTDEVLAVFRLHEESISGSGRLNKAYQKDLERIFLKYKKRNFNNYDNIISMTMRIYNRLFI